MTKTPLTDYARTDETTVQTLERAAAEGLTICSYSDPTSDAREGLTVAEAAEIAREDAGLIYVATPPCLLHAWQAGGPPARARVSDTPHGAPLCPCAGCQAARRRERGKYAMLGHSIPTQEPACQTGHIPYDGPERAAWIEYA